MLLRIKLNSNILDKKKNPISDVRFSSMYSGNEGYGRGDHYIFMDRE